METSAFAIRSPGERRSRSGLWARWAFVCRGCFNRTLWLGHFNYSVAVFRLARPEKIDKLQLAINGTPVPLPQKLRNAPAQSVWQVPLPANLLKTARSFEIRLEAPGWKVSDFALVGDPIRELHLRRTDV